jgi:hypothetical protein
LFWYHPERSEACVPQAGTFFTFASVAAGASRFLGRTGHLCFPLDHQFDTFQEQPVFRESEF